MIPFNKPHLTGKEAHYTYDAYITGKLSGNGKYTKLCHKYFEEKFGFRKALLTTSCTDALEMCALLLNIKKGDEVIVPSYTFVSSALAFVRQGAKIVFADSCPNNPNLDVSKVEKLITKKTIAIVAVHYAGVAVDMDPLMEIARKNSIFVVEDAAQAIDSYYNGQPLGTIGHLSAFSFHETKNIICGEGGMLGINDDRFIDRAEVIWEKGTNRASFFRGEINKYGWVDIGSSFLPSEATAAFLFAQLEDLEKIQNKRKAIWDAYYRAFKQIANKVMLPETPNFATNNGHMFYLVFPNLFERSKFIDYSKSKGVLSVFHYLSLHKSDYYNDKNGLLSYNLPFSDYFTDCLVRIPLYCDMSEDDVSFVIEVVLEFFKKIE